ncbi:Acetolactate synthase isozyme 3 large subunit [Geodia barretti]|uniref:Acetolactate synthase isozyme 3 large subunit n=1 Tax=Geodia barretti TaxID=519541 RepID=A0AA35XJW2_GEOBA|nr:Acetolactate synthase isozyme 3 large subunit [Geodia barretti]
MGQHPVRRLTGQVPTHMIGNDAFQEAGHGGITGPAQAQLLVKDANDVCALIREAYYIAGAGRHGPVVVGLPKDVVMTKSAYVEAERAVGNGRNQRSLPTTAVSLPYPIAFVHAI